MSNVVASGNYRLDANLFHLLPTLISWDDLGISLSSLLNVLQYAGQTSLMTDIIIIESLIWDEILTFFVDCIVSQVHTEIIEVAAKRWNVFFGCKSGKSFLVQEHSDRNHRRDQEVDTQVELQVIDQVRFVEISLGDVVLASLEPVEIASEEDAFALATCLGLDYKCFGFPHIELFFETF